MRRVLFFALSTRVLLAVAPADAQTPAIQKQVNKALEQERAVQNAKKTSAEDLPSLDDLIAQGLKSNPDIRVAESRVREAEAILARTRMQAVADIVTLHADLETAHLAYQAARKREEVATDLHKRAAIPQEEYRAATLMTLLKKSEMASKRAKLPYLVGKDPSAMSERVQKQMLQNIYPLFIDPIASGWDPIASGWVLEVTKVHPPGLKPSGPTPMMEKLRKLLDTPTTVQKGSIAYNLEFVRNKLPGVNLHVHTGVVRDREIDSSFKDPIPLGAFLQFLEDEVPCVFVLRDYGIVVATREERIPPGAVRVTELWKQGQTPVRNVPNDLADPPETEKK